MALPKRYICTCCRRLDTVEGSTCKHCTADVQNMMSIYTRLVSKRPELRGLTPSQVMLQLVKAYLSHS